MKRDWAEPGAQGASLLLTLGLLVLFLLRPPAVAPVFREASKPTQVTLSVVEEPPPPPAPPPSTPPPPEPPPMQTAPSPLPLPPPPQPRHIIRPHHPPVPRPVEQVQPRPQDTPREPSEAATRPPQQAPENHSAEAAYIGRLRNLVERNTRLPESAAYRLGRPAGDVQVTYRLTRAGAVSNVQVARGSGSAILDRQAVLDVSTQHYPAMPQDVYPGQASHDFVILVTFPHTGAAEGL